VTRRSKTMTASLTSVNVGLPKTVQWRGQAVTTGIFKSPVEGPVALRRHNLAGDQQADLSVHGGPTKAVYVYPTQHYAFWRTELPDVEFGWGHFGENFSVESLDERSIFIGDEYRVGTARVVVTEPRMPCFKLGIRFDMADMPKRFLQSGRSGFYFGVVEEGEVQAGDALEQLSTHPDGLTIADVTDLYTTEKGNVALLRKAIGATALPDSWKGYFANRLERLEK
jgi:MOSC domain-containing protein YiiM